MIFVFRNKGQIIIAIAISRRSSFELLPLAPSPMGGSRWTPAYGMGCIRGEGPELRKPGAVRVGSSKPVLCFKGGISFIIIDDMYYFPLFQRKTLDLLRL